MTQNNNPEQNRWKEKYIAITEDLKHYSDSINDLRHGLSRISIAAKGIDASLDRQLIALRREIRNGSDNNVLQRHIAAITELVKTLDDKKKAQREMLFDNIKKMLSEIRQLASSKILQLKISTLISALNSEMPERAVSRVLTEFLDVIAKFLILVKKRKSDEQAVNKGGIRNIPGMFSKLWKQEKSEESHPADKSVLPDTLKAIVVQITAIADHVPLNSETLELARSMRVELDKLQTIEELVPVLELLSDIIAHALSQDKLKFENFLSELNGRLQDVSSYLTINEESDAACLKNCAALDRDLKLEIKSMQTNIQEATDLEALANSIRGSIINITDRVDAYRLQEETRVEHNRKELDQLKDKLQATESTADTLRTELHEQRHSAQHDVLTGLPNRVAYNQRMADEYGRWVRYGGDLVLAVADIDHFKKINDTYGHLAGDKVLKKIGQLLGQRLRASDFAARYGGEEFVIILENTTLKNAAIVLDKLRIHAEALQFHFRGIPVRITISFGVTQFSDGDTPEDAFARADRALYDAKQRGRNQVMVKNAKS